MIHACVSSAEWLQLAKNRSQMTGDKLDALASQLVGCAQCRATITVLATDEHMNCLRSLLARGIRYFMSPLDGGWRCVVLSFALAATMLEGDPASAKMTEDEFDNMVIDDLCDLLKEMRDRRLEWTTKGDA